MSPCRMAADCAGASAPPPRATGGEMEAPQPPFSGPAPLLTTMVKSADPHDDRPVRLPWRKQGTPMAPGAIPTPWPSVPEGARWRWTLARVKPFPSAKGLPLA